MSVSRIRIRHSSFDDAIERNMVSYSNVTWLAILCCTLSIALAREKQIKLEDIERDNLSSEKQVQKTRGISSNQQLPQREYYVTPRPQTVVTPQQFTSQTPQPHQQQQIQQIQYQQQQEQQQQQHQQQYATYQPTDQYIQQYIQQYLAQTQNKYSEQPEQQYQYITDNSIAQAQPQAGYVQLYSQSAPQYVYIQPSNDIQEQGKPTPGIQYVMYVDPNTEYLQNSNIQSAISKQSQTHNLQGLIQRNAYTNVLPQNYRGPASQTYAVQGLSNAQLYNQPVYVLPRPTATTIQPQVYQQRNQAIAQQRYLVPGVTYVRNRQQPVYETQQAQVQQAQQSIASAIYEKKQPKSLLDSYVPSILQIQYYNQLQQQANAIPQEKLPASVEGKGEVIKSLGSIQDASTTNYNYQIPTYVHGH